MKAFKLDIPLRSFFSQQVKQECIPVGCVPPTLYRTGRGLCLGESETPDRPPPDKDPPVQRPYWTETPGQRSPCTETPLDRDPAGQRPPCTETPLDRDPPEGTWDQRQRPPLWTDKRF